MTDAEMGRVLDAYAGDADEQLLVELRQYRSDPGTGFDEALGRLQRRLEHLRADREVLTKALAADPVKTRG